MTCARIFLTIEGEPRKRLAVKKLAEARPDLLDYLGALQERFCKADERRRAARAASLAEAALVLIETVRRHYESAKRRRGALDYDDLIAQTLRPAARSAPPAPGCSTNWMAVSIIC